VLNDMSEQTWPLYVVKSISELNDKSKPGPRRLPMLESTPA
jgi:hypothetical protein